MMYILRIAVVTKAITYVNYRLRFVTQRPLRKGVDVKEERVITTNHLRDPNRKQGPNSICVLQVSTRTAVLAVYYGISF